mgnify:CR=1 FL=1
MGNIDKRFTALVLLLVMFGMMTFTNSNASVREGDMIPDVPITIVSQYETYSDYTLHGYVMDGITVIAFMPTIQNTNEYANVMTSAFQAYINQALGFDVEQYYNSGKYINVILVTNDNISTIQDFQIKNQLYTVFVDNSQRQISSAFGIDIKGDDASSTVMIIDEKKEVVYVDEYYRGQGENLQILMSKLNNMLGIEETYAEENFGPIYEGDKARDFNFDFVTIKDYTAGNPQSSSAQLSDFIGKKNILLGFYPAPFSFSCGMELSTFDYMVAGDNNEHKMPEEYTKDLEVLMVSNESMDMLTKWFEDMSFKNVKLISDLGANISAKYNSFDFMSGYNNRTLFLIDKEGVIRFIDWDYNVIDSDLKLLQEQIMALGS